MKATSKLTETAYLVALYRALETDRPDALFQDPLARRLAGGQGELISSFLNPQEADLTAVAIRTRVIDEWIIELVMAEVISVVLNLGAGLDTRPYRLPLPQSMFWIEVDFQEILADKEQNLRNEKPACTVVRVPCDLADGSKRKNLLKWVNALAQPTLVITEGLLGYLSENQVSLLASDLQEQPYLERWLFELASPAAKQDWHQHYSHTLFDQYFANGDAALQFSPELGAEFFHQRGWAVAKKRSIWEEACQLKRNKPFAYSLANASRWFAKTLSHSETQDSSIVLLEQV